MTQPPRMNRYARHVLLRTGRYCDPDRQSQHYTHACRTCWQT